MLGLVHSGTGLHEDILAMIDADVRRRNPELIDLPTSIVGNNVMLRPYRTGDGPAFFNSVNEDRGDLATWVGWVDNYKTVVDAEAYVRRMQSKWLARTALIVGIFSKDGSEHYGGTGYHGFDWNVPSFELGYFLKRSARGHGYGTEAVSRVIDFAFAHLHAKRIWASCDARNAASIRLLERCGLEREAEMKQQCLDHHGSIRDTLIYAITEPRDPRR